MNCIPYNIPQHTRCINCGECCGPFPISISDYLRIKEYIKQHPEVREVIDSEHKPLECVFRDGTLKRCAVYPVRPMICRLYGVIDALKCPQGNSASVKGINVDLTEEIVGIQNFLKW